MSVWSARQLRPPAQRLLERGADAARVARYLRGLAEFRVRPDDVFISSYPRSGTTWLQHIAHTLRSRGDLGFSHISEVVPWFERPLALGRKLAADFEALPSPRIFKSHLPRAWLPRGARYLYVQRDGRDVAVSYHHFYRSHLGFEGGFSEFFERFLRGRLQYRSWFKHVAGWQTYAHDAAQLIVVYETLQRDLPEQLQRIAQFCGISHDPQTLAQLSGLCDFAFMRAHEAKFDHAAAEPGRAQAQPGTFIRRGVSGGFEQVFSQAQQARFERQLHEPIPTPTLELHLAAFLH